MTTGKAIHRADDGTETDITEGVQALYDLVISSMDFGSGFWTEEDAAPVSVIGHALGFDEVEQVDKYIADRIHDRESTAWYRATPAAQVRTNAIGIISGFSFNDLWNPPPVPAHDHVLSSVGRCMWPRCKYTET